MTLELAATPEEVMRAVTALQEFCVQERVPEPARHAIALALEESGSNVVTHAFRRDARRMFRVSFSHSAGALVIEIRDDGPGFDPTKVPAAGTPAADADRVGGWGIPLIRRSVDQMSYRREGGENVLRLVKRLDRKETSLRRSVIIEENHTTPQGGTSTMPLEIQILQDLAAQKAPITVKLAGSLDTATAPELERKLAPVMGRAVKEIVFDLTGLKFISSAGLRVFSIVRKQLGERGGQASFINMQPQIKEVFDIIKSLPGVRIFKDLAEFDAYLEARQRAHERGL